MDNPSRPAVSVLNGERLTAANERSGLKQLCLLGDLLAGELVGGPLRMAGDGTPLARIRADGPGPAEEKHVRAVPKKDGDDVSPASSVVAHNRG